MTFSTPTPLFIKLPILLTVTLLMAAQPVTAQSALFSQYYFSPLNVNPALLGTQSHGMAGVQHRTQWRNLANPHQASALSLAKPVFLSGSLRQAGGIGLSLVNETVGTDRFYRATGINLGAAYNLSLNQRQTRLLSFGLQGGFTQRRLYLDRLQWGSQYDPAVGYNPEISPSIETLNDRVGFATFTAGLTYHYNPSRELLLRRLSGFTGLAVANLNRPYASFHQTNRSREALLVRWHSGLEFPVAPSVRILPQALVAYRNAQQYHVNVGTYVHYAFSPPYQATDQHLQLLAGAWYRWNDSWVTSAGLSYQNYLLAVSYDFNTQPVAAGAFRGGAFEVSLSYRWFGKKARLRNFSTPMI